MMPKSGFLHFAAIPLALAISACGSNETAPPAGDEDMATPAATDAAAASVATASLKTSEGADAGTATVSANADGLVLSLRVTGLPPGPHGAHVHTTGKCDAPTFETAGGHWNPADKKHGLENPAGQHAGDMPNLVVAADGAGTLEYTLKGGTAEGLLGADGAAMVIHANADDQKTDPSGDSGGRIACGVFTPG